MQVGQFLDKNGAAVVAVVGALAGVLISQLFSWLLKKREWNNQKNLRRLERSIEFEKRNLIEPILEYVEHELSLLQIMYARGFEKEPSSAIPEAFKAHHEKLLPTSAKVKVYGDQKLVDKFDEFSRKMIQIGYSTFDQKTKNIGLAFNDLKEAESIAVEILATLKRKLSDIET